MRSASIFLAFLALSLIWVLPGAGCRDSSERADGRAAGSADAGSLEREIVALGRLRPLDGIVSVSAIPGERLATLAVGQNSVIKKADTSLGLLASYQLRTIELAGLEAQRESAQEKQKAELAVGKARAQQATVALAQAKMKRSEVALNQGDVDLLREQVAMAKADLDRLKQISRDDPELVTKTELDRKDLEFKQLDGQLTQAAESLELGTKTSKLAVDAAAADLRAAEAVVKQIETSNVAAMLEQKIAAAEVQKKWAELPAPCTGTVLKVFLAPGEFVSRTPILQIADLSKMGCVAEVYEADVKSIHEGDNVILESKAFRNELAESGIRGEVERIGKLIGQPDIRSLDPMARTDRHIVEVLIKIDPDDAKATTEAARLIDLQVTVKFLKKGKSDD